MYEAQFIVLDTPEGGGEMPWSLGVWRDREGAELALCVFERSLLHPEIGVHITRVVKVEEYE